MTDDPYNDSITPSVIWNFTVEAYRRGCIEYDASRIIFVSCNGDSGCHLKEGDPCGWQSLAKYYTDGLNCSLVLKGPLLLVTKQDASIICGLIENRLLEYVPPPRQFLMPYSPGKRMIIQGYALLIRQFNDSLAILDAQGWRSGYSPEVILPFLKYIAKI